MELISRLEKENFELRKVICNVSDAKIKAAMNHKDEFAKQMNKLGWEWVQIDPSEFVWVKFDKKEIK